MLVNVNGRYKTPITYYLTNSLPGEEKSILIKDLLIELCVNKIDVFSVTFDGDKSNQKSVKLLGANFDYGTENFQPYFPHPVTGEPVYVFFDACHMLKLVRNYFAKEPIYNNNEKIDWNYLIKLNEKQYSESLHCACKIRNRHIYFHNEKMKVFLAAQVLSTSVAASLKFFNIVLKDPEFGGSDSTSEFCQNFNNIFDILNSKNLFCKTPGRTAMTEKKLPELKKEIDKYCEYIEKLEIDVKKTLKQKLGNFEKTIRQSVLKTESVRTGFIGFIICLKNFYSLCKKVFESNICKYVLSYKLSQDHIEMFFSVIRRMNGNCHNPTAIQFLSAYKKLLLHNMNVPVPASANCSPQDNTLLISDERGNEPELSILNKENIEIPKEEKKKKKKNAKPSKNLLRIAEFLSLNNNIMDYDYSKKYSWVESSYLNEIIMHTAGAVVHQVIDKIHCEVCRKMLLAEPTTKSRLTMLKNRGGLKYASDDVVVICHSTEKIIRFF